MEINQTKIGPGHRVYIIAELSANHANKIEHALRTIEAAKKSGANAIKFQTYTADSLTLRSNKPHFQIKGGTLWDGKTLHQLYEEAATPWEWHPKLFEVARGLGLDAFSTAFDEKAVDFLETLQVPIHKVASFELVDHALISKMARTGKPLILSTGMATLKEIEEAVKVALTSGAKSVALLKCTSAYPAAYTDMNLQTIRDLAERFRVPIGLSDHSLGISVPIASVALGACIIEKHFTIDRKIPGPDAAFSLEPKEFATMVEGVRQAEDALGQVVYGATGKQKESLVFRRSLFIVQDIKKGEVFTSENIRSIRPGHGISPKHLDEVLGRKAAQDLSAGTPLFAEAIIPEIK